MLLSLDCEHKKYQGIPEKKKPCDSDKQPKDSRKKTNASNIEIKLQFLYVVLVQYHHQTSADAHLQYYCT